MEYGVIVMDVATVTLLEVQVLFVPCLAEAFFLDETLRVTPESAAVAPEPLLVEHFLSLVGGQVNARTSRRADAV